MEGLVNVLDLRPSIVCDRPLSGGESAEAALTGHSRQFVASSFVQPPVHVIISLPCSVRLQQVELHPYCGRHHLRSAVLLAAAAQSPALADLVGRVREASVPTEAVPRLLEACGGLCKIACLRFPAEKAAFVVDFARAENSQTASFMNRGRHACVRVLVLKVTSVYSGCVPAFHSLRIFANGQRELDRLLIRQHQPLHLHQHQQYQQQQYQQYQQQLPPPAPPPPPLTPPRRSPTPEEFVDPITCELMRTPVLLPCGKSVDQTTLQRCQLARGPQAKGLDPFTGLPFGPERRPVFNSALKLRLDDYLAARRAGRKRSLAPDALESAAGAKRRSLPAYHLHQRQLEDTQQQQQQQQQAAAVADVSCYMCNAKDTRHTWYEVPCSRERVVCYACRMSLAGGSVLLCKLCWGKHAQSEFRSARPQLLQPRELAGSKLYF